MRRLIALGVGAVLAGCAHAPTDPAVRPDLPEAPADLRECFAREFPEIPAAGFGRVGAVRIVADAKLLDRAKTACGDRAIQWIEDVRAAFGRQTS